MWGGCRVWGGCREGGCVMEGVGWSVSVMEGVECKRCVREDSVMEGVV